jgi:hypothetical protein
MGHLASWSGSELGAFLGAAIELVLQGASCAMQPNTEDSRAYTSDQGRLLAGETLVADQPEHLAVAVRQLCHRLLHCGSLAGGVDLLFDARHVVGGEVPPASEAASDLANTALTAKRPHPLAMGDTEDPRRRAAAPGVEATAAALQQCQEGVGDEVDDVSWIAAATGCVAKHQAAVAAEDQLQGRRVRLDPGQQLGISRFVGHVSYWRAGVLALQPRAAL